MSVNVINYNPYCEITANFPIKQSLNNGWTAKGVIGGMPQKFDVADGTNTFAMGRKVYTNIKRTGGGVIGGASDGRYGPDLVAAFVQNSKCCTTTVRSEKNPGNILGRHVREVGKPVSGNKSMVCSSDDYIQRKKNVAIGKGTNPNSISLNNYNSNKQFGFKGDTSQMDVNRARRKTRSSGYIVPPKCTNNRIC